MSDVKVKERAEVSTDLKPESEAVAVQQKLSSDSKFEPGSNQKSSNDKPEVFTLPHLELLKKAEENGKNLLSPSSQRFNETCKLYEQAIEKSYGPTLSEVQKMSPEVARKTYISFLADQHAPAAIQQKYAEFLSGVGERSNNPALRQKALDQLNSIGIKDPVIFSCCPEVVGERRQLEAGKWIDKKSAASFALTQVAINRLGVKQSFLSYAADGFSGPTAANKRDAVEALAYGLLSNPEFTRSMVANTKKEVSSTSATLLQATLKEAELEAGRKALEEKSNSKR